MKQVYDVIIVGGGPAGLSSAIYLTRAKYSVLVIEKEKFGGQITITSEIVNYPGVMEDSGEGLTLKMKKQAQNFGAEFKIATVKELKLDGPIKKVITNQGEFKSIGLVLAVGASPRKLGFPGEKEFQGRGIAYCATCDGEFFEGCELFVIGGGFAACEEALFLTQYASKITMIVREKEFTCAQSIADEVKKHPQIKICFETEIIEAGGNLQLEYAIFRNNRNKTTWRYDVADKQKFGIFIFAGYVPANHLFKDQLLLNDQGYLITDRYQKTNIDGVYGAGDICDKELRQVVTAVSDGAIAATSLEKYISQIKKQYNLSTKEVQRIEVQKEITNHSDNFISNEIRSQLLPILDKITKDIYLVTYLNNDSFSLELKNFVEEFSSLSSHIHVIIKQSKEPYIDICDDNKRSKNLHYYLIPGGHEFNSFVLAIYNIGTIGQPIEKDIYQKILNLKQHEIQIFVSLSCTMCPEVVQSVQRIAIENENVCASIYDLKHYPEYKEKYNIMSVPCTIIDRQKVIFGKKSFEEIVTLIEEQEL